MTALRSARHILAGFCLGSALAAAPAWAMSAQGTLGEYIFGSDAQDDRRSTPPPVARYVSDEGQTFVLDRSGGTPLMKFENSSEVLVLRPSPASRGDVIYRDDLGEPVLRATKLGGLTLFFPGRPAGAPVAFAGQAPGIRLPQMSAAALLQRLAQASIRASRAARRLIVFDAQEVTPGSEAVFADAAAVAAEAVTKIVRRRDGKALMARFGRILFVPGPHGEAALRRGVLAIQVNPSEGLAGRPSSARIVEAAAQGR